MSRNGGFKNRYITTVMTTARNSYPHHSLPFSNKSLASHNASQGYSIGPPGPSSQRRC
ncbi:hypothetical protein BD777DRAFT_125458 [Yarrowia lipolytica]|nr:hypothetical protein BD777DRAFT_125458 [Yarrowia lipolytica]